MEILLSLSAIVISIIAISRTNAASLKVAVLEKKLEEGKNTSQVVMPSLDKAVIHGDLSVETVSSLAGAPLKKEEVVYKELGFIKWLKEDWLLKFGGLLVLMGILFFLSVAVTAVGPQGKITIGYIFGIALMVFGFRYAAKQLIGGSAIHLVGATVVIITTYVARIPSYNLFDPYLAMLLMFLTSVCVALTAFMYKRSALAHVGLCMSAAVPLLVTTDHPSLFGLLMYLGVVVVGVMWLSFVTQWRTLILLALSILIGYSAMYIPGEMGRNPMLISEICLVIAFGTLFYLTSLLSIVRSKGATGKVDGIIALLNAGFTLMWIIGEASKELAPLYIAFIGLIYAVGFFFVYKITNIYNSFMVYGGVALGMLTTAIVLVLSGRTETMALLLIGAGVSVLTYYLSHDEDATKVASLFSLLPFAYVITSMNGISDAMANWYSYPTLFSVWKDLFIITLAMSIYYALYSYFSSRSKNLGYVFLWVGNFVAIVFIWQVLHIVITGGFATVASDVIYTIIGLVALLNSAQQNNLTQGKVARIWLGLVAARVIFWDAWQSGNPLLGVFICIAVGILLLSSTFIIKKVTHV